jgi:hypothetical protein
MTDIDALTAFCRARLDEEERDARAATPGPWVAEPWRGALQVARKSDAATAAVVDDIDTPADAVHIARQDPAATLARVAALRALVGWAELHLSTKPTDPDDADAVDSVHEAVREAHGRLAAIWCDHPDYPAE